MAFFLFVLVNAALFLRLPELMPDLQDIQLYQILIIPCFLVALPRVGEHLTQTLRGQQPLTMLVIGLLPVVVLSHLSHGELEKAGHSGFEFFKVLIYYLLLVSIIDSPVRLRRFIFWLLLFASAVTLLAVFRYYQVIQLPTVQPLEDKRTDRWGFEEVIIRLCGTGIFNDPNDFCLLLLIALPLCLQRFFDGQGYLKVVWAVPMVLMVFALALTQSRGGFLAFLVTVFVLLYARFGPRMAVVLVVTVLPALFFVFAGRQTQISTTEGTAQERFHLWREAFVFLQESPLFGIGAHEFDKRAALVAHNSFLHCFGELGLVGGFLFLSAFVYTAWCLIRPLYREYPIGDPILRPQQPYLLAMLCGCATLMLTLSRSYLVPTYLILGLAWVQAQLAVTQPPLPPPRLTQPVMGRLIGVCVTFLLVNYLWLRLVAR